MKLDGPLGDISTRAAAVARELRSMILSGQLEPGSRLRQVEVAANFKVSTTPVREAFVALEREGLVHHDAQRGVVVFNPTMEDVRENYEIRIALEPLATQLAALEAGGGTLSHLAELVVEMRSSTGDAQQYQALNREFHRAIYAAARRPRLARIIESLRDAFEAYVILDAVRPDQKWTESVQEEHEKIAEALIDRSPQRAREAMEHHLIVNADHFTRLPNVVSVGANTPERSS